MKYSNIRNVNWYSGKFHANIKRTQRRTERHQMKHTLRLARKA